MMFRHAANKSLLISLFPIDCIRLLIFCVISACSVFLTFYLIMFPSSSGLTSTMEHSIFMAHVIRLSNRFAWVFMYASNCLLHIAFHSKISTLVKGSNYTNVLIKKDRKFMIYLWMWFTLLFAIYWTCNPQLTFMSFFNFLMMNLNNYFVTITLKVFQNISEMNSDDILGKIATLNAISGPFLIANILYVFLVSIGNIYLMFYVDALLATFLTTFLYKLYLVMTIGRVYLSIYSFVKSLNESTELVSVLSRFIPIYPNGSSQSKLLSLSLIVICRFITNLSPSHLSRATPKCGSLGQHFR